MDPVDHVASGAARLLATQKDQKHTAACRDDASDDCGATCNVENILLTQIFVHYYDDQCDRTLLVADGQTTDEVVDLFCGCDNGASDYLAKDCGVRNIGMDAYTTNIGWSSTDLPGVADPQQGDRGCKTSVDRFEKIGAVEASKATCVGQYDGFEGCFLLQSSATCWGPWYYMMQDDLSLQAKIREAIGAVRSGKQPKTGRLAFFAKYGYPRDGKDCEVDYMVDIRVGDDFCQDASDPCPADKSVVS